VWLHIERLLHARKSSWKAPEKKLFHNVFTQKDPKAESVLKGGSDEGYEPDTDLRDFENIPLNVHVHRPPAVTLNKTPEEFHISTGLR